eukprot:COSAG02_NODE_27563_length_606_cov_42.857988_1_plen_38_part_10
MGDPPGGLDLDLQTTWVEGLGLEDPRLIEGCLLSAQST